MMKKYVKVGCTLAAALLVLVASASPSLAVAGAGFSTGRADNGLWLVTAECTSEIGATTNGRDITFVVEGSAQAEGPAVSTAVRCFVYQGINGQIGGCGMGLPGAVAVCASTAQGDLAVGLLSVCAEATATYVDGSIAETPPCP
jgi:hypothetical protein